MNRFIIPVFFVLASIQMGLARAEEIISPSVRFPARDAQTEILGRINDFSQRFRQVWNAGLWDGLAPLYAGNACMLPPGRKLVTGQEAILAQYRQDHQSGIMIQVLKNTPFRIWSCGDLVVTAGQAMMSYTMRSRPALASDYSKVVDVWGRKNDGSLGLLVDSWVDERGAAAQPPSGDPGSIPLESITAPAAADTELQALFERVRKLDVDYYRLAVQDPFRAADVFAENGILISTDGQVFEGREKIRDRAKAVAQAVRFDGPGHQVILAGGNAGLVYVVYRFNWKMKNAGEGEPQMMPGKGVHLWKRKGEDWSLALELFNTDLPIPSK